MKKSNILHTAVLVGLTLTTLCVSTSNFNQTNYHTQDEPPNHHGKRNTKFILPALISHMYHQKLDPDITNILNRPFAKKVSRKDNEKRENSEHNLEHKTMVGNARKDEHVRNIPKTKCPRVKTKGTPALVEMQIDSVSGCQKQQHEVGIHGEAPDSGANKEHEGSVIEVNKHFSPINRNNWYSGPPSLMWPPYPNSYGMPLNHYASPRFSNHGSKPLYSISPSFQRDGFIQHIMGQPRIKFSANTNSVKNNGESNRNLIAHERKFVITNTTKYVLDFYCPHCGGEISVSKNRNKGGLFTGKQDNPLSVNKGGRESKESQNKETTTPREVT